MMLKFKYTTISGGRKKLPAASAKPVKKYYLNYEVKTDHLTEA